MNLFSHNNNYYCVVNGQQNNQTTHNNDSLVSKTYKESESFLVIEATSYNLRAFRTIHRFDMLYISRRAHNR